MPGIKAGRVPRKWLAFATAASATFTASVNTGVVNISLPTIGHEFSVSMAIIQWVLVMYLLVCSSLMPIVGYLGDVLGRRRIYILGGLVLTLSSLLCAIAQAPWQLIAFRGLLAIGSALVLANGAAVISDAFEPKERGQALGICAMVGGFGMSAGPAIGGVLLGVAGWRSVFFVGVPLSLSITFFAALFLVDKTSLSKQRPPLDLAGAAALFLSIASFLLLLTEMQENGWNTAMNAFLAGLSLASGIAFYRIELRAVLPTIDLNQLRNRVFAYATGTASLAWLILFAVTFLTPFYLAHLGYTTMQSGVLLTAVPLSLALSSPVVGWLSDRVDCHILSAVGMLTCTVDVLMLSQLSSDSRFFEVGGRLFMVGLGIGIMMSPNTNIVMGAVPSSRLGMASAFLATSRQIGASVGIAISSALFTMRLAAYSTPTALTGDAIDRAAAVAAFRDTYLVVAVFSAIGIATSMVKERAGRKGGN